ncbi:MAG: hypothetical protein R3E68_17265 [Burkholderiaceae bacterium]
MPSVPRQPSLLQVPPAGSRWQRLRPWLAGIIVGPVVGGCSLAGALLETEFGGGERAAYRVWNDTGDTRIERPELIDPGTGHQLYVNLGARMPGRPWVPHDFAVRAGLAPASPASAVPTGFTVDPGDEDLYLPRPMEGAFALAPAGHRVPATVMLRWREPARPGQAREAGRAHGPLAVPVRSQIPPEVLALAADGWRYRLDIAIAANTHRPEMSWRLMRQTDQGAFEARRSSNW